MFLFLWRHGLLIALRNYLLGICCGLENPNTRPMQTKHRSKDTLSLEISGFFGRCYVVRYRTPLERQIISAQPLFLAYTKEVL